MHRSSYASFLLALAAACFAAGCGGGKSREGYVINHPDWAYDKYERVAVLPGRSSSPDGVRFAQILVEDLESRLTRSRQFSVMSRSEMREIFAEQDLSRLADAIDEGTALPEGKLQAAQAIVAVRLTNFQLIRKKFEETRRVPARDAAGRLLVTPDGRPIMREVQEWVFRHGAELAATVRVVDAATGKILVSETYQPEPEYDDRTGEPPKDSPEDMATRMVRKIAAAAFKKIAPTEVRVNFKTRMIAIARDYFDGRYSETDRFSPEAPEVLIAVRELPQEAEGNDFRIAVSADGGRENFFEEDFTWTAGISREGLQFRVPMESVLRAGGERFVAKLYSRGDPEPKLTKPFRIVMEK